MTRAIVASLRWIPCVLLAAIVSVATLTSSHAGEPFVGKYFRGEGDVTYLRLLDISRRMLDPDPEFQNLPMLYTPAWNGFVEGPTWGAWWIQNSYGTTYCALPLLQEPYLTFLQNSHDLWFTQMGDGQRAGANNWVPPDGCLCDAASPGWIYYKQGDGRIDIHDWGVEFTAAGLLMQAESLLISRDPQAIQRYLPMLERCAAFIESRRDRQNNLFLAGPAGNLLAPSYAGWKQPDGTYRPAYLVGLSVTYIAALDRLIELERLTGAADKVTLYTRQCDAARQGLAEVTTDEGYLLKSLDPDGARHGVFGAAQYGYFEAVCNHDAICFRTVSDQQSQQIMNKLRSIPGLRPHDLIITNYPSLDDMYVEPDGGLWKFGTWVNGGHWTTCEARMIMAYYRLNCFDDAARSMQQILRFARDFRLDNPLVEFGNAVYQPGEPINLCYDSFGAPAAMLRGLFEYLYRADRLTLVPHVPPGITRLQQDFPVRFGTKRLYLATAGSGPITAVTINGQAWDQFNGQTVDLPYDTLPEEAEIVIALGSAAPVVTGSRPPSRPLPPPPQLQQLEAWARQLRVITNNDLPLRIGADSDGNNRFLGQIARARVFSRALSAEEIAQSTSTESTALDNDPALLGDWWLGRRSGQWVPNAAGEFLRARVVGEASIVTSSPGQVLQLDGLGYLEIAPDARLDFTSEVTLEAWICPREFPASGMRVLDKSRVGTSNGFLLDTHPGNSLRVIVERGALSSDAGLTAGQWAHVAATVTASGLRTLYVNGRRIAATDDASVAEGAKVVQYVRHLRSFYERLAATGLEDSYEARHARLAIDCYAAFEQRRELVGDGLIPPLPPSSSLAADSSYLSTIVRLYEGLAKTLASYQTSDNPRDQTVFQLFSAAQQ